MKTIHSFKASRFYLAMIVSIGLGQVLAAKLSSAFDLHLNPVTVAFASAGIVAVVISVLFENRTWE